VLDQNTLARQILSSNMVLIYPNTPAKQKDYEEQIVHTFYLTNAGAQGCGKHAEVHARRKRLCSSTSAPASS